MCNVAILPWRNLESGSTDSPLSNLAQNHLEYVHNIEYMNDFRYLGQNWQRYPNCTLLVSVPLWVGSHPDPNLKPLGYIVITYYTKPPQSLRKAQTFSKYSMSLSSSSICILVFPAKIPQILELPFQAQFGVSCSKVALNYSNNLQCSVSPQSIVTGCRWVYEIIH